MLKWSRPSSLQSNTGNASGPDELWHIPGEGLASLLCNQWIRISMQHPKVDSSRFFIHCQPFLFVPRLQSCLRRIKMMNWIDLRKVTVLVALAIALWGALTNSAIGQTINKPSVQVTLRTHQLYYRNGQRDDDTWSWSPRIAFRVNGPISAGSQLSVDFTLPSGKAWVHFDCNTNETKEGYWWHTECGMNSNDVKDEQASIETGIAGFKINLKNELEGTNKTLFAGKFKVDKFHVGVVDLPKFKN